jgi:hypothetical protein
MKARAIVNGYAALFDFETEMFAILPNDFQLQETPFGILAPAELEWFKPTKNDRVTITIERQSR